MMIGIFCLMLLCTIIVMMCLFIFIDNKISKKIGGSTLFLIAVSFIVFSLFFKPQNFIRWDLLEHFKLLNNMRLGGFNYATNESQYSDLFIYNYFVYFISLLPSKCQNLLTAIPLAIDFIIVGYIYKKTFSVHLPDTSGKTKLLAIMLWLFTFGIKLAISGIRCSLAVSIAVLAIYLEMIQKKKKVFSILLYFTAIFIHNFAIVIIFVRLLAIFRHPIIIMISSLGISSSLAYIARFIVNNISNTYLSFSFQRILDTITDMSLSNALQQYSTTALITYMCFIILSVYLFIIATKESQNHKEDGYCKNVVNFASTVGAVAIGLSFNYLYLERYMYLVSFALLMIVPIHNKNNDKISIENAVIVPLSLFAFFFNDIYIFMVNYVGRYFLAF